MKPVIGFVYDLRKDYLLEGFSEEDVAEFDSEETIDSLRQAIENIGYTVECVGNAKMLSRRLVAGDRWDMVFNIAESFGGRCRESYVPAMLELYGIPYTFSDAMVCALTLDKSLAKQIVRQHGLATPEFAVVENSSDIENIKLNYPLFAKPLAEGTGKGIDQNSRIETPAQLKKICIELLAKYHQPVLVEEFLPGREFTVGVLGNGTKAWVLGTMEIEVLKKDEHAIYSFLNKEECESRIKYNRLSEPTLKEKVETLSLRCYQVLQCRDAARIDIRLDRNGQPSFIEVNPLAGLHPHHSDLPMIATWEKMPYETLIKNIIDNAFSRVNGKKK
jgi:D-alanine-D-alanine ligase